jgi:DnaA-homolog protein
MRHLKRDLPSLIATLDALDEWSLKTKKPVTIPLLKELIG